MQIPALPQYICPQPPKSIILQVVQQILGFSLGWPVSNQGLVRVISKQKVWRAFRMLVIIK